MRHKHWPTVNEFVLSVGITSGERPGWVTWVGDVHLRDIFVIAEKVQAVGIEHVPAVFELGAIRLLGELPVPCEPRVPSTTGDVAPLNLRHEKHRRIIGGIQNTLDVPPLYPDPATTIGFVVRDPIPWWFDDLKGGKSR